MKPKVYGDFAEGCQLFSGVINLVSVRPVTA